MYNNYFGFSESPFENTIDQRFLFLCEDHREVLAALLYFVKEKKGLAIVCGDVGTGKTMLIHSFLSRLPATVQPISISNPLVSYLDLLNFIALAVGIGETKENVLELIKQIKEALLAARKAGKDYLLIVDEAHLFSDDNLEQIRLLSNIEIPEGKLLQILLVGQYELSHKLNRPEMRQLRQRINVNRFLSPLTPGEAIAYINHRLQIVGSNFAACFEPGCENLIYQLTGGFPRLINQLSDNALLRCMAEGRKRVNRRGLKKAHEALLTDAIFTPKTVPGPKALNWKVNKVLVPLAVCAALLVSGIILDKTGVLTHLMGEKPLQSDTPVSELPASPPKEAKTYPLPQAVPQAQDSSSQSDRNVGEKAKKLPSLPVPSPSSPSNQSVSQPPASPNKPLPLNEIIKAHKPDFHSSYSQRVPARPDKFAGQVLSKGQVTVTTNDTLGKIAATWFPENVDLGLEGILLANPETNNEDIISPGLKLNLPSINASDQTITLPGPLCYAVYGRYFSTATLQKALSKLGGQEVRYIVLSAKNARGDQTHRVIIGGYESKANLDKALKRLGARPGDES